GGFSGLEGLTLSGGDLFVSAVSLAGIPGAAGGVFRIPILPDGTAGIPGRVSPQPLKDPVGLAADPLGTLYVGASGVYRGGTGGSWVRFTTIPRRTAAIAFDPAGNLYVVAALLGKQGRLLRFRAPHPP